MSERPMPTTSISSAWALECHVKVTRGREEKQENVRKYINVKKADQKIK